MATHDPLTGLPNRTLILDRVEQMLARSRRSQTPVAALFLDLDNFKDINDTLGHAAGDELLRAVAARLDGVIRGADALGRLGGDEFVVISEELSLAVGPELIAERLLETLKEPFKLGADNETRVTVTASIGIAAGHRTSAEELLRDADIAMYRAKWDGKNRHVVFETGMQDTVQSRMELEMDLREALGEGRVLPRLSAHDRPERHESHRSRGADPLEAPGARRRSTRRLHPAARGDGADHRRRQVGPGDGLRVRAPSGERPGIRSAWPSTSPDASSTPISSSPTSKARSRDSGLDPEALTIEITETTLMRNIEETARRLDRGQALGVRIAIDDFGTGYSSLAHLQRFPVDALKIDRSFILGLKHNQEGETLIRTLVQLGKSLSIETFAEGIEQQHELSLLRGEDCDSGQGFLFARPLDVAATEAFLQELDREHRSRPGASATALLGAVVLPRDVEDHPSFRLRGACPCS